MIGKKKNCKCFLWCVYTEKQNNNPGILFGLQIFLSNICDIKITIKICNCRGEEHVVFANTNVS